MPTRRPHVILGRGRAGKADTRVIALITFSVAVAMFENPLIVEIAASSDRNSV
jgi:hypothetical protein